MNVCDQEECVWVKCLTGRLGYLVNMTRPDLADLAFAYSELSKYLQRPGKTHMAAAE